MCIVIYTSLHCEYKIIIGDNKMINQDLYEMIFKRKSFHLFRNVGDKRLSLKEIEDIKKTYKTLTPLYADIKTEMKIMVLGMCMR